MTNQPPSAPPLTHYENRLLRLRERGLSLPEIASVVGKAHQTIKNQMHRIYQKLGTARPTTTPFLESLKVVGPAMTLSITPAVTDQLKK